MLYVTDTHPIVWFLRADARLSASARAVFEDEESEIIVPTMVLAEIAFLYARQRIAVNVMDIIGLVNTKKSKTYPLDDLVISCLPLTLDIHDAVIVATALVHRDVLKQDVALITRDQQIAASGLIRTFW